MNHLDPGNTPGIPFGRTLRALRDTPLLNLSPSLHLDYNSTKKAARTNRPARSFDRNAFIDHSLALTPNEPSVLTTSLPIQTKTAHSDNPEVKSCNGKNGMIFSKVKIKQSGNKTALM
jgi:hypothetical protein